jgi:hypothetical protein
VSYWLVARAALLIASAALWVAARMTPIAAVVLSGRSKRPLIIATRASMGSARDILGVNRMSVKQPIASVYLLLLCRKFCFKKKLPSLTDQPLTPLC